MRAHAKIQDELLWAAAWLYKATNNQYYLSYLGNNGGSLGGTGWAMTEFGWDVKYAGVQTLVAKVKILGTCHFNSLAVCFDLRIYHVLYQLEYNELFSPQN